MSSDKPYTVCPACGKRVEPDDPDVIHAVEVVAMPSFGKKERQHLEEGRSGLFCTGCSPEAVGYSRRPRP